MDDFAPPEHDGTGVDDVDLDEAPRPAVLVYLAAGFGVVSGLLGLFYGVQLLVFIRWYTAAGYGPYAIMAVSVGVIVSGALALRLRPAAAFAFAGLAGLQLLLAIGWTVYVLFIPLLTALGIFWPLACLPTLALAPFAIPPALQAASFRRRLLEDL